MLAPERRRRGDLLVAAAIATAVAVAVPVIWLHSDARGTTSVTAEHPAVEQPPATAVPDRLTEIWRHPSGATSAPLTPGGAVVAADDGTVTGLDPASGRPIWSYQRNMPLCGADSAWGTVVAVYRDRRGCSQVSELAGSDGARRAARTSYADAALTLHTDGTYVVAQGDDRLEVWRSDLVRTLEYGKVIAPQEPNSQPRSGCELHSATSSGTRLAVVERCAGEAGDRLTVLDPAPKDSQKPEEYGSVVLGNTSGARALAAVGDRIVVYRPGDRRALPPRLVVYGPTGAQLAEQPLSAPMGEHPVAVRAGTIILLWTGAAVVALRSSDLLPAWSAIGALGPGTMLAGRLLIPVVDAVAVLDPATGQEVGRIPVRRADSVGLEPIMSSVVGDVVLEQRAGELVALR